MTNQTFWRGGGGGGRVVVVVGNRTSKPPFHINQLVHSQYLPSRWVRKAYHTIDHVGGPDLFVHYVDQAYLDQIDQSI